MFETSAVSSLKTMAKPASKWKSMWQWRNQGPGLSVCARGVSDHAVALLGERCIP